MHASSTGHIATTVGSARWQAIEPGRRQRVEPGDEAEGAWDERLRQHMWPDGERGGEAAQKCRDKHLARPLTVKPSVPRLVKVEIAVGYILGFDPGVQKLPWIDRVRPSVKALQRCERLAKRLHRPFSAVVPSSFGFDGGGATFPRSSARNGSLGVACLGVRAVPLFSCRRDRPGGGGGSGSVALGTVAQLRKKEILSLFDRRVTSDFLGSGEDAALSAADRLMWKRFETVLRSRKPLAPFPPPPARPVRVFGLSGARDFVLPITERHALTRAPPAPGAAVSGRQAREMGALTAWGYKPQYLDIWLDFAQRAAVALNIPCSEIKVLPDAVRRYTVFKAQTTRKKKDVWEWRRYFRQVDIFDAHPDVIDRWVHYAGTSVGDHVFWNFDRITYDELGVGTRMLEQAALENGGSKSPRRKKRLSR
ncbi:MAG: hypothetical protein BJ554DRAFT_4063 [Olpidium bornovanus]|uniref:Small ribosomal subunit protein uS10 domain-containing protein n=1 Tax=Olpidium bornovanus TaxID=278681 RepID=A0A8H8DFH5_9FUNG|nr:MAG: hypothetical protein BJ554DRAFT_4063 [Olpidium bornovanus]